MPDSVDPRVAAIALVAGSLAAAATDGLVQWTAVAVAIAGAIALWPKLAADRRAAALLRFTPHVLLVALAAVVLAPLVRGEPPATRDHAIHYFHMSILRDDMLPAGVLSGWTDRLNHGFPWGEGYPVLPYLWVLVPELASLGLVDGRTSYAWGLLGLWALSLWGVWQIAAAVFDEIAPMLGLHRGSAWAGCAGASAWLLDPGSARQGGWNYLMFHGVWPQQLSTALWIAAVVWSLRAFTAASPRRIAMAAICFALSLLAHPFGMLTLACTIAAFVVVAAVLPAARGPGRARVLAIIVVAAVAAAAGGLAKFFASAGELGRAPVGWLEYGDVVARFVVGDLFAGPWAWFGPAAVVGIGLALWSRRPVAVAMVVAIVGMLVLGSQESVVVLGLDLVTSSFKNLQFPRFAIAVKPLLFALAGVAVALLVPLVRAAISRAAARTPPSTATRVLLLAIVAPAATELWAHRDALLRRPIGAIDTLADTGHAEVERELAEALAAERAHTEHMRVAFLRAEMGGATYPLFALAELGVDVVLDGHVPTINFDHIVERRSVEVLRRLGVTHVIHDRPVGDDEAELDDAMDRVGRYGPYELARFTRDPSPFVTWAQGDGRAQVRSDQRDRITWDVAIDGERRMVIGRAPSDRWRWSLDGEPLESEDVWVRGGGLDLLGVDVPHSGTLELRYHVGEHERRLAILSAIAFALLGVALVLGRPLVLRPLELPAARRRLAFGFGLAILAVGLAGVARRQREQLARTWEEIGAKIVRNDPPAFVADLAASGEIAIERGRDRVCEGVLGKDVREDCDEADHRPHVAFTYIEPFIYRCAEVGVAAGDTMTVRMGAPGDQVLAFVVRRRTDSRGRALRLAIGEREATTTIGNRRADLHFRPERHPDGAMVRIVNDEDEPEQICIAAARVR